MFRVDVTSIDITTDESGNASVESNFISGEILKIVYLKGTINAATMVEVKIKEPLSEIIDSYDVNGGNAARYPRAPILGAAAGDNKWAPFITASKLLVSVSGEAASKAFRVIVYSK